MFLLTFLSSDLEGVSLNDLLQTPLGVAIIVVGCLIVIMAIASAFVSIFLFFKYMKFNRRKNVAGLAGKDVARELLDKNGLQNIKVKAVGSIIFGNSYSHYFKKVRLRRLTWKKDSLTSLAMAAQKTGLAVLDKEGDKDMKQRVALTPVITFGPLAFIPIIVVGVLIDYLIFNLNGVATIISAAVGFLFMILSLLLQLSTLKTEIKAQEKAYVMLKENKMATNDEIEDMQELFKLYNIEYVNNIIISFLEIIYKILVLVYKLVYQTGSSSLKSKN